MRAIDVLVEKLLAVQEGLRNVELDSKSLFHKTNCVSNLARATCLRLNTGVVLPLGALTIVCALFCARVGLASG